MIDSSLTRDLHLYLIQAVAGSVVGAGAEQREVSDVSDDSQQAVTAAHQQHQERELYSEKVRAYNMDRHGTQTHQLYVCVKLCNVTGTYTGKHELTCASSVL